MTQITIKEHNERFENNDEKLMANLFWYSHEDKDDNVYKGHELGLLDQQCSQKHNSCTEDVIGNRKVFVSENNNKLDQIFLVIVNKASPNDPTQIESFQSHFKRVELETSSGFYFVVCAVWVFGTMLSLIMMSQLASRSDQQIALQKLKYLDGDVTTDWTDGNMPPMTPKSPEERAQLLPGEE